MTPLHVNTVKAEYIFDWLRQSIKKQRIFLQEQWKK